MFNNYFFRAQDAITAAVDAACEVPDQAQCERELSIAEEARNLLNAILEKTNTRQDALRFARKGLKGASGEHTRRSWGLVMQALGSDCVQAAA